MSVFAFISKLLTNKNKLKIKELNCDLDNDFIVTKDETADMLTIEELKQKNNKEIVGELNKFGKYYSKDELLSIFHILSSRDYYFNSVISWLIEDKIMDNEIRGALFKLIQKKYYRCDCKAFIIYCDPSEEEKNIMCDFENNISNIEEFIDCLIEEKKSLTSKIENKAINILCDFDKQIDQKNMDFVRKPVAFYANKFFNVFTTISIEQRNILFNLILKDINYERYYKCGYSFIKSGLNISDSILMENPKKTNFTLEQRDQIFNAFIKIGHCLDMYNSPDKYYLSKNKIQILFNNILEDENNVSDILKSKLYFSQLKQIIRALPNFKNERCRNECIEIIAKNFRGTIAKCPETKEIFDSLLLMKKLSNQNKNIEGVM